MGNIPTLYVQEVLFLGEDGNESNMTDHEDDHFGYILNVWHEKTILKCNSQKKPEKKSGCWNGHYDMMASQDEERKKTAKTTSRRNSFDFNRRSTFLNQIEENGLWYVSH